MFHQDAHDALEDWVNRFDLPEIHRAVLTHRGQDTTLKDTLASTTDINMLCHRGWTPLEWGIRTFVPGVVDILLECGADLRKGFPLHQAALRGNIDALKSLIRFGADVNLPDKNGRLPLHYAAYRGETNIVEELVRVGGDNLRLDAPDHRGRTVWDEYRQGRIWYTGLGYPPLDHDRVLRILSDLQASRFEADPRRLSPDRTLSEQGHRDESHKDEDDSDITMPGSFPKD
ncbi:hypothetical protein PHLCEN_2v8025 [Hermanssonia centrifuga]|uniref:Uncharacterized protein n=1 Tax=Hermanssonia centrifuga TaxID=98765 RepID=A0A2R6NUX3_9APHY|nr:hypothetical protein PHLCEN_2v8025 [Hermanssonia centrifuga]